MFVPERHFEARSVNRLSEKCDEFVVVRRDARGRGQRAESAQVAKAFGVDIGDRTAPLDELLKVSQLGQSDCRMNLTHPPIVAKFDVEVRPEARFPLIPEHLRARREIDVVRCDHPPFRRCNHLRRIERKGRCMPEAARWPAVESTSVCMRRIFHQIDSTRAAKVRYLRRFTGDQTTDMYQDHGSRPSTDDMLEGVERKAKIRTDISQDDSVAGVK